MSIYSERIFECTSCNKREKRYKWSDDENPEVCLCKKEMEELFETINEAPGAGGRFKKGRPKKDAEKRRLQDFKKNTLPTLYGREKKYFEKKLKNKGI